MEKGLESGRAPVLGRWEKPLLMNKHFNRHGDERKEAASPQAGRDTESHKDIPGRRGDLS